MPTTLGEETKNLFLNPPHGTRLHVEFTTGGQVRKGQQVKLSAAETVVVAAANEPAMNIVGISMHDADEAGELVTVAVKGYACIIAASAGAITVGPVEAAAYNTTLGRPAFVKGGTPSVDNLAGWAIDPADGAGEEIRVIVG